MVAPRLCVSCAGWGGALTLWSAPGCVKRWTAAVPRSVPRLTGVAWHPAAQVPPHEPGEEQQQQQQVKQEAEQQGDGDMAVDGGADGQGQQQGGGDTAGSGGPLGPVALATGASDGVARLYDVKGEPQACRGRASVGEAATLVGVLLRW